MMITIGRLNLCYIKMALSSVHECNIQTLAIELYKVAQWWHLKFWPYWHSDFKRFLSWPFVKTERYGKGSIRYFGPLLWGIVPKHIKMSPNVETFKSLIKKWKPKHCTCRLCKEYIAWYWIFIIFNSGIYLFVNLYIYLFIHQFSINSSETFLFSVALLFIFFLLFFFFILRLYGETQPGLRSKDSKAIGKHQPGLKKIAIIWRNSARAEKIVIFQLPALDKTQLGLSLNLRLYEKFQPGCPGWKS